jgi:hypothetical protein
MGALETIMNAFSYAPCMQPGILLCMSGLRLIYTRCTASNFSPRLPFPAFTNNRQRLSAPHSVRSTAAIKAPHERGDIAGKFLSG